MGAKAEEIRTILVTGLLYYGVTVQGEFGTTKQGPSVKVGVMVQKPNGRTQRVPLIK